jgi:serine phosphatase RsbU (regulator of sigma subunit)
VLVAESARAIRKAVLAEIGWHLMVIAVAGVVAASILNVVLLQTIDAPLRRLVATVTEIGRGRFGAHSGRFNTKELTLLARAVDGMSTSLAEAEQERRIQMEKAREIQRHLLPTARELPGLRVSHLYRPATDVSGDYYDVFGLPDDAYLICMADVVGHGIPAAMSAAMLKVLLQEATRDSADPADILAIVNQRFMQVSLPSDFASMLLVRWDPRRASVDYASAGHGTAWLSPKDSLCRPLKSTGLLLGIDGTASWETQDFSVGVGDRLLLATDGVTETSSVEHELFGPQRVRDLLEQNATHSVHDVVQRLEQALCAHRGDAPQTDDVTLVLLEFTIGVRTPAVLTGSVCHAAG